MKFLGFLSVFLFINCCTAATNRSTVWFLSNSQIYSYSGNYAACTYSTIPSSASTLLSISNTLSITSQIYALSDGANTAASVVVGGNTHGVLSSLTIQFIYNSSYSLTLTLPTQVLAGTNVITLNTATVPLYLTSSVATYPTFAGSSIMSPTGSTWLNFQTIGSSIYSTATPISSGILITDYISSSTISIGIWSDAKNSFYMLGVRSLSSKMSGATGMLATGCAAATGRKRSVDHLIKKRAYSGCTSATSIDGSLSASTISSACTATTNLVGTTAVTQTVSRIDDAFNRGVVLVNALSASDSVIFSASCSKFTIFANFGILVAISNIIFIYFN